MNFERDQELIKNTVADPRGIITPLLWGDNKKIGEIPSICFETALNCSSAKMGYCDVCRECYGVSDAKQYKGHRERMERLSHFIQQTKRSVILFRSFCDFLKENKVDVLRFNIVGDFSDSSDIEFIRNLATELPYIRFYGYTKRFDLGGEIEDLLSLENVFIGVPFEMMLICPSANIFDVCDSVREWDNSENKCLGDCGACKKCYTLKGEYIGCFIHGSPSKIQKRINTLENWAYVSAIACQYLDTKAFPQKELPTGLFVKKAVAELERQGVKVPYTLTKKGNKSYSIKTVPQLLKFIRLTGYNKTVKEILGGN